MRVAVISDLIRPNGAGVMALLAADILTGAGHEVAVLAGAMQARLCSQIDMSHAKAGAFTHDERSLDGSVTPTDHVAFVSAAQRWLRSQIDEFNPDVFYVHNCGRILSQLDLADLSTEKPVLHTMHDEWFISDAHYTFRPTSGEPAIRTFEPGRSESVLEHRYEHLFEIPGRAGNLTLVAPSEWLAERARAVFPTLTTEHLPNAVDTSLFELQDRESARARLGLPDDRAIALFVGNPTQPRKGFLAYEDALRHAVGPDGDSPLRLVIGGSASAAFGHARALLKPGPIVDHLNVDAASSVVRLDIGGDGIVLGGIDRALMPLLYGAADVMVHPSRIDNLPTVPIESALCGTRCFASDVGGTRETIADIADLFELDAESTELGNRLTDAFTAVADETVDDRTARRATAIDRHSIERHRTALLSLLERVSSQSGVVL